MRGGSKSIERVGAIMRALENGPEDGMSTGEIAEAVGFDRATTHRAIVSLERIGFVDRNPSSRTVRLGIYMFSLGAKTARRFSVLSHAREVTAKLAEQTGDTVFLHVRNKFDCVCIDRRSGSFPIKAQTLSVGESIPLGVSTAGVAILATMSDDDVRHAVQFNAIPISEFHRVKPHDIYEHVSETRRRGYAKYFGHIIAGMGAIGYAIRDARGVALAAISISAIIDRLTDERIQLLAGLLKTSVEEIERRAALVSEVEFGDR
jgi:DNA-binding IclR family transcriptional regulator